MSKRNQPYLPLYVQDYLTDEKLNMCSLSSQGVYIKIMCILHKSDEYGTILLKQKDKQNQNKCLNFARKLSKLLPIQVDDLKNAINELIEEGVLTIDGDKLYQKRMVKDNDISAKRSEAGKKGGEKTQFAKAKVKAKHQANSENEIENEYENENESNKDSIEKRKEKFEEEMQRFSEKYSSEMLNDFYRYWTEKGTNDKKMRFEKEKTFGIDRRLATWKKNESKFNPPSEQKRGGSYKQRLYAERGIKL